MKCDENFGNMDTKVATLTVETLINKMNRGVLNPTPKYQRGQAWSNNTIRSELVESMILKIPVPSILLAEDDDGKQETIDGQQRLTTLLNFINGKFKLSGLRILTNRNGMKFQDLDDSTRERLLNSELSAYILIRPNDTQKQEVFRRLNKNIVSVNNQEILNAAFSNTTFNNLVCDLASIKTFRQLIGLQNNNRKSLEKHVSFFLTLLDNDKKIKSGMDRAIGLTYDKYANTTPEVISSFNDKFIHSVKCCSFVFKDKEAFRVLRQIDDGTSKYATKINERLFGIVMCSFCSYKKNDIQKNSDKIRNLYIDMLKNGGFDEITNGGSNAVYKYEVVYKRWNDELEKIVVNNPASGRFFEKSYREKLFNNDPRCGICNQEILRFSDCEVDHISPYSLGGDTIEENAQLVHASCNKAKGSCN